MPKPDQKPVPTQLKLEWHLTEELKARVLAEVQRYLAEDCYDFTIEIGGLTIRAGDMATQGEEAPRNEDASRPGNR